MATTAGDQQHKHRPQHPGKHPVAQPGHQWRQKNPQAPSKTKGNDPRAPPKKRQEPLGRTARTHSTGRRNQKISSTPAKAPAAPLGTLRTPTQHLHYLPQTATTIPRSPPLSPRQTTALCKN